jgi:hypothetical protein
MWRINMFLYRDIHSPSLLRVFLTRAPNIREKRHVTAFFCILADEKEQSLPTVSTILVSWATSPKKPTGRRVEASGAREMREPRWSELASEALIVPDEATEPVLRSPARW